MYKILLKSILFYAILFYSTFSYGNVGNKKLDNRKNNLISEIPPQIKEYKYKRSSLDIVLIESQSFPNKDVVMNTFTTYPFPDKYNNNEVFPNSFNPNDPKYFVAPDSNSVAYITMAMTGLQNYFSITTKQSIDKFIEQNNLPNLLIDKWFNRTSNSDSFNMNLIQNRGDYNASVIDAEVAQSTMKGSALLSDAGEQLINNTFVVFVKMYFLSNDVIASIIKDIAIKTLQSKNLYNFIAAAAIQEAYEKGKVGYSVWTKGYLYKLNWNDSIGDIFYTKYYNNPNNFDTSHLFNLSYVGDALAKSLVTYKGANRSQDEIIKVAVGRNIDNLYASLQKKYDVFKPVIPIININPIMSQIGLKEGIKKGDKFHILQVQISPTTNKTSYKIVKTVTVSSKIWDNRYAVYDSLNNSNTLKATIFKGSSKNVFPGMLIKQVK